MMGANQMMDRSRATLMGGRIKRKFIVIMLSFLVVNNTSLFFHNRSFETPAAKKSITNDVEDWMQGLLAPPPPIKKHKASVVMASSTSSSKTLHPERSTSASTKPTGTSCAIVFDSTTELLKQPVRGKKRHAQELETISDADDADKDTAATTLYGGIGEDEDDTMEQAAAALSPVKASDAARMSMVSQNFQSLDILVIHQRLKIAAAAQYTQWDYYSHPREEVIEEI
jgi:hypothetical protein